MQYTININNHIEIFDIDKVARQAAGAVLLRQNNTVVLATVAHENKPVDEDFLPLTVQYIEKAYAAGRIPGGYIKRETKPSDLETLSARIIDRSLRPLFPKGYNYPTQITVMVLSCDSEVDLQVMSLNAASIALYISDIAIKAPVCGVRIAKIDNEFILNPTNTELKNSTLDLFVSGIKDELLMIEMRTLPNKTQDIQNMNELSEDEIIKALNLAQDAILKGSNIYESHFIFHRKSGDFILKIEEENIEILSFIEENYIDKINEAIFKMAKSERTQELDKIAQEIINLDYVSQKKWDSLNVENSLKKIKRKIIRSNIINHQIRADGRGLKDIRPISIETNILPQAHGSCLFTRGQTQALAVVTLGNDNDAQMSDILTDKNAHMQRFMVNYNFPGFCVGEASPIKAPGRRELGHGNLASRALYPSIDQNYPHVIRLVSEILESNGSSSMATVCGGSLALRAAGVNSTKLVAGVAMGLVFEDDKSAILTDIMGLEDHDGDMDFKVAGSTDGVTALQMDIKLGGIDQETLKNALYQAKEARLKILNIMKEANNNIIINEAILPKLEIFQIESSKIVDIIGQGGKTIKEIIEKFDINIDLDRELGSVKISGYDQTKISKAKEYILKLISKNPKIFKKSIPSFEIGEHFIGKVKNITSFGVFVELKDGIDGLIHNSKIKNPLNQNDEVEVVVCEIKNGKIALNLA